MKVNFNSYKTKCFSAHSIVDKDILEQIRSKSSNPFLYAYVVFHEGHVNAVDYNTGNAVPMYFSKHAIKQAFDKIEMGSPVFAGHTDSNQEYIFEPGIARVVGKEMVNDNAVIIVHGTKDLDGMPSVSAEFELILDNYDNVIEVTKVSGFAMLNYEAPAFNNAKQFLKVAASEHIPTQSPVTFNDVQSAVKALNIFPWQLYTKEQLLSDKIVSEIVTTLTADKDKASTELETLKSSTSLTDTKSKIAEIIRTNPNLTDQQKMFIQQHADTSDLSKVVDPNVFVNDGLTKYQEVAKMFGTPTNPTTPPIPPTTNPPIPPTTNPNIPQIPPVDGDDANKDVVDKAMEMMQGITSTPPVATG